MENKTLVKAYIVSVIALMHNSERYEVGSEIQLTDEEHSKISQYVRPAPVEVESVPAGETAAQGSEEQSDQGNEGDDEDEAENTPATTADNTEAKGTGFQQLVDAIGDGTVPAVSGTAETGGQGGQSGAGGTEGDISEVLTEAEPEPAGGATEIKKAAGKKGK